MIAMTKDLSIRGFDEKTHAKLNRVASQKGVSVNAIVKDLVDKWLEKQDQVRKKHDLILYSDDESMSWLLKSIDRFLNDGSWFRTFCGPPSYKSVKLLKKLDWFDSTIHPYSPESKNFGRYTAQIVDRIVKESHNKPVCWFDFVIENISNSSLKEAIHLESQYDENRLPGMTFCNYRLDTLLNAGINDLMDLFSHHDQVFILKDRELVKMHITKEGVQKLLLD
ncbi:hypothetical protein NITUZ_140378 [Candidatus Nitrosotenuis uzonensis]|uniref:Uncharacterized protein n=2 Tax=Candidatus Nitrosotenuis uzonensis TaxID=1407055 RepID=V6AS99_9ARCH|nr:hypothetical protein NITUZ_140378 [Candidatus Nitrosotenuis uzonensis]